AKPSPLPTARTFFTTARSWSRAPRRRSPTTRSPGRSTWASGSPSRRRRETTMAMEARLSLRQSQRVVMTPLLQQAIQLLQLSTLELQEVVQTELLEYPLLGESREADAPDAPQATAEAAPTSPVSEPPPADSPSRDER